ncbi:MAG: cytochrome c3 family protein [Anaerolineales bacterium]|nr:MAG: cytochrome c3 family protein [Anaerolineales bacterium]
MSSWLNRIVIALIFALVFAGVTLMVADAQEGVNPPVREPAGQNDDACAECHTDFQTQWMSGPHGQSGTSSAFLMDWEKQGKPGACLVCHATGFDPATATWEADGVSCSACHVDEGGDHPKTTITTDDSPELCGRCHSDTRFGWGEWEGSTHYARGMECTTCHDAHSASLKFTVARDGNGFQDASQLCISCHREASMEFPYTKHHQQGVSCINCHVDHLQQAEYQPHTVPDHSFKASLNSCNTCHSEQMHASAEAASTGETSVVANADVPVNVLVATAVTPEPTPVSPMGYAGLAGLLGLAGGIVLAPWLEKFYRREVKRQHTEEDENE